MSEDPNPLRVALHWTACAALLVALADEAGRFARRALRGWKLWGRRARGAARAAREPLAQGEPQRRERARRRGARLPGRGNRERRSPEPLARGAQEAGAKAAEQEHAEEEEEEEARACSDEARASSSEVAPGHACGPSRADACSQTDAEEEVALCVVCMARERGTAFGCGHACTCVLCAKSVDACPLCRAPKGKVLRLFF
jgi:hypothetical protein